MLVLLKSITLRGHIAFVTAEVFQQRVADVRENCWARIADAMNSICAREDLRVHWISYGIVLPCGQFPSSINMISCSLNVSQALSLTPAVREGGV